MQFHFQRYVFNIFAEKLAYRCFADNVEFELRMIPWYDGKSLDAIRVVFPHGKHREGVEVGRKIAEKGYTLMPLQVYVRGSYAKVEVGLAKGKKLYDKRADIAKKDQRREAEREFKLQLK